MVVYPKHLEWDFSKRAELEAELERGVANGEMAKEDAEYLLSSDRFRPFVESTQDNCFLCGEKLKIPAVIWHGCSGSGIGDNLELWLHPECAERWAQRLIRDARELKVGKATADAELARWKSENEA